MRNTPEAKKAQLLADLTAARGEVTDAVTALAAEDRDVPFLGVWSAHDIVAHLVGWDGANLEAIEAIQTDRLPACYAAYDPDWRTFNAGLVAGHKRATLAETLAAAQASHQTLLDRLAALPAAEISRDYAVHSPGGRRVTIAMLLGVEAGVSSQ
ncbi:MAG: DinB family protein [Chloroflexi bacterium]|nr:DinB family protein [Chloroflexota bacterium]